MNVLLRGRTDVVGRGRGLGQRPDRLADAALLALATTLVVAWRGFDLGESNQSIQLVMVKRLLDPGLYTRDLLVGSFAGYPSFFFQGLAALVRVTGHLEAWSFVLYAACHGVALAALYAIARLAFRSPAAGVAACLLYLARPGAPGAEYPYWARMTHAHAATALLLWTIYLFLRGRLVAAFALAGVVANLHALYAVHLAALLGLSAIARARELGARRVAAAFGLFLLLAAPSLVWAAGAEHLAPGAQARWLEIMRERSSAHVFPFSWPAAELGGYALFVGLVALATQVPARSGWRRLFGHAALATALLCLAGVVFAEIWPVPALIRAQLLRASKWLLLLSLVELGRFLHVSWAAGGWFRAAAALAALGLLVEQRGLLAVSLLTYLIAGTRSFTPWRQAVGVAALLAAAVSGGARLPQKLGLHQVGETLGALLDNPVLLTTLGLALLVQASRHRPQRAWRTAVCGLALGISLLGLLPFIQRRERDGREADPWYQVQVWVRENTPRDALFLTPPYQDGFRVFSERAVVGEWKDGTQQFFSAAFGFEWWQRMSVLKGRHRVFDQVPADRLLALAHRYGAGFLVVPAERSLDLPLAHANAGYAVYRVPPPGS